MELKPIQRLARTGSGSRRSAGQSFYDRLLQDHPAAANAVATLPSRGVCGVASIPITSLTNTMLRTTVTSGPEGYRVSGSRLLAPFVEGALQSVPADIKMFAPVMAGVEFLSLLIRLNVENAVKKKTGIVASVSGTFISPVVDFAYDLARRGYAWGTETGTSGALAESITNTLYNATRIAAALGIGAIANACGEAWQAVSLRNFTIKIQNRNAEKRAARDQRA